MQCEFRFVSDPADDFAPRGSVERKWVFSVASDAGACPTADSES